ncbi:MAG: hypothetical protein FWD96_04240, partial [Defluviitaleaceae bacterium]|nr:hypothetical protein [Defluviitaleaceae bacterium]
TTLALSRYEFESNWERARDELESELIYDEVDLLVMEQILDEWELEWEWWFAQARHEMELEWIHDDWLDNNLVYNSTFDRVLLNMAGPERFWLAAYTSNDAYGALWDEYMSAVISHDEIQLIRGFVYEVTHNNRPQLASRFYSYTNGLQFNLATMAILNRFNSLIDQERGQLVSGARDNRLTEYSRFRSIVSIFTRFAEAQGIEPQPSVLDFVVINHYLRDSFQP